MITQFRVQNYKALRDVTLDLTPMHLLIGPNDSGKTSILEAIAALCRSVDHDLGEAFTGAWSGRSLVWQHATESNVHLQAAINLGPESCVYGLVVEFAATDRRVVVAAEKILVSLGDQVDVQRPGKSLTGINRFVHHSQKGAPNPELMALTYWSLKGAHVYRWNPQHLALPVAPDSKRLFRMEPSGFGLALCLDDILGYDRDRFIALEERFKSIFESVDSIKLISEPAYRAPVDDPEQVLVLQHADGKGVHFQFKEGTNPIAASQVSDGVLLVLAYLAILYLPEPPRVLLIEEPENGIHPARLEQVLTILRDLVSEQTHTQVILTTHSPYVVSLFQPEEVTLCHKGDDGAVEVRRLSESEPVRNQIDFFTLGEIWTGEGDEALMQPIKPADQPS